tara:strand:- start:2266 stop:2397 length:132 start_codon:yes stop_codon:yes gene_type:complete
MTLKEEYRELAQEIVEKINQTTNDYDAIEQIETLLTSFNEEEK